jgi:bifunctional non-homologous end joining protein LigD
MQNRARSTRVEFWAFDILHLDGRSLVARQVLRPQATAETLAEAAV